VGDVGIVLEPTELKVATAERGRVAFTIRVPGRSAHAGQPTEGLNPISRLPAVLAALDAYTTEITQQTHPLLGSPSCTPTIIRGGTTSNAVPDYCDITVDRRLLPGETISGARALLERCLQRASVGEPEWQCEVTTPVYAFAPAEIPDDSPFALQVCEAVRVVTGAPGEIYGTPFSSDVHSLVNDAGMEAVTFGPGKITECHCCNERMSLGQLTTAALATAYVASELLL
jgi:succinyl-diaminopimelate desuccinylase